jgi:hypothetical protein
MNVVITAHAKNEYGPKLEVLGTTFDGYKKLDYIFDLVLMLDREHNSKYRAATVVKTRLKEFPDGERFPWNYEELKRRYGQERLEKGVDRIELATPEQIEEFRSLLNQLSEQEVKELKIDKALATVEDISDLPLERIVKGIQLIKDYRERAKSYRYDAA